MKSRFSEVISLLFLGLTLPGVTGTAMAQNYQVLKAPSFEEGKPGIDDIWQEITEGNGVLATSNHDGNWHTDGSFSGMALAKGEKINNEKGHAILRQEFLPRAVDKFNIENGLIWDKNVTNRAIDGELIYNIIIYSKEGHKSVYEYAESKTRNLYRDWHDADLSLTDHLYAFEIYSEGESIRGISPSQSKAYGQQLNIDNIRMLSIMPDYDAGIVSVEPKQYTGAGEYDLKATIKNFGAADLSVLEVQYKILTKDEVTLFYDVKTVDLLSDSSAVVDFGTQQLDERAYKSVVYVGLAGDENPNNDSLETILGVAENGEVRACRMKVKSSVTNGILNVIGVKSFDIYDIAGKKVANFRENPTGMYNINNLPNGIYLLRSSNEIKKVIKIGRIY